MGPPRLQSPISGSLWMSRIVPILGIVLLYRFLSQELSEMQTNPKATLFATIAASLIHLNTATIDLSWHAPNATLINNLTQVIRGAGVYGFIYNSSAIPTNEYGVYNWCNMPHVRATEYTKPTSEYKLQYVEVVCFATPHYCTIFNDCWQIHRHHKRTVYASNSFPVESYEWNCDDEGLFYYGQPKNGNKSTPTHWQQYISSQNPFIPSGFLGTCQFPQITAEGLDDSWQHGKDLYGVYHDLLGFLPDDATEKVNFRVTQNVITSEVAGMVINGMFKTQADYPLLVQVRHLYAPGTSH